MRTVVRGLPTGRASPGVESVAGAGASSGLLISHDMNTQLDYINDLLEKDSELRDVCDPLLSGVSLLPKYRK